MPTSKLLELGERYDKSVRELRSLKMALGNALAKCELQDEAALRSLRSKIVHAIETMER